MKQKQSGPIHSHWNPKPVELVRSTYQPTNAEMEETFSVRKRDGSEPTIKDLATALMQRPAKKLRFVKG